MRVFQIPVTAWPIAGGERRGIVLFRAPKPLGSKSGSLDQGSYGDLLLCRQSGHLSACRGVSFRFRGLPGLGLELSRCRGVEVLALGPSAVGNWKLPLVPGSVDVASQRCDRGNFRLCLSCLTPRASVAPRGGDGRPRVTIQSGASAWSWCGAQRIGRGRFGGALLCPSSLGGASTSHADLLER